MVRSVSFFLLLILLAFQGCSFDFLNTEESPVTDSSYTEYDSAGDIQYCYDSEDELLWYEYYDFNDQNQCIFVKHCLPSGTVVWSYVYSWTGSNLTGEAYFGSSNTLSWFNNYNYSGSNPIQKINYNENSSLEWFQTWSYSSLNGRVESAARFNSAPVLEWAYQYEYDGSGNPTSSSHYAADSNRTANINYEYDGSISKKATGFGSTTAGDTFEASCSIPSFPTYGGVNKTSRNEAGLKAPPAPTAPTVPTLTLNDVSNDYSWMTLWLYDAFGYTSATLNADYLPVYMIREAPAYLNNRPLEMELSYSGDKLINKKTIYNNQTVLNLDFSYNGSGYLTSLNTSGTSLYIPLRYDLSYTSQGVYTVPESIRIYNGSTLLQYFNYAYSGTLTSADVYARYISTITHYDGDKTKVGTYVFDTTDPPPAPPLMEEIEVYDASDNLNGTFELTYDDDGSISSFLSKDAVGNKLWESKFNYDTYGNRISESLQDKDDQPDVADFFSVESFIVDLNRFFP